MAKRIFRVTSDMKEEARKFKCVQIVEDGVFEPCGKKATKLYVYEGKLPVCYCADHDPMKGEDAHIKEKMIKTTKEEYETSLIFAY